MNERKSKIIGKIADNNCEPEYLQKLFETGVDVMWLNTAHQDEEGALGCIERIHGVSKNITILLDTKGPEIRTKNVDTPLEVKAGDSIIFSGNLDFKGENVVHVDYANFHNEVPVGELITYDDSSISTRVVEVLENGIRCTVKNNGTIKNKKSLNIPNVHINLPSLTPKDIRFLHFAAKHHVDYIIHSFVRNVQDIQDIKDILKEYPEYKGKIIAKIENREGVNNTNDILDNCDGLMVARGDLMAEVQLEELPYMQKKMVEATIKKGKYCIVATEVLGSMVKNPHPTRAEVCDVANAVLDGTHGISMSGETAYGDFPIEATHVMDRVMRYTELKRDELVHFTAVPEVVSPAFTFAKEVVKASHNAGARAIVTAVSVEVNKAISAYHPTSVVIAGATTYMDLREMVMGYALRPVHVHELTIKNILAADVLEETDVIIVCEEVNGVLTHKKMLVSEVK